MTRGLLFLTSLLLTVLPGTTGAQQPGASPSAAALLDSGDYARAYAAAQSSGDALTASLAAAAQAEYRAGGREWITRAVTAARQAALTPTPDTYLALGSALGLQARASGFTLGALHTAQGARAALERGLNLAPDRADIQAVLAEWHAAAWAKAGLFSGGNAERARTLATAAARRAPDSLFVQAHAGAALGLLNDPQARAVLTRAAGLEPHTGVERDLRAQAARTLGSLRP